MIEDEELIISTDFIYNYCDILCVFILGSI